MGGGGEEIGEFDRYILEPNERLFVVQRELQSLRAENAERQKRMEMFLVRPNFAL